MQIKIDGKIYDFKRGQTVLEICQENGIKIPSLCSYKEVISLEGVCRLCLVKTNQTKGLVTSCQLLAEDYMEVWTNDEEIEKVRRYNLELLWTDHAGKCSQCLRNGNCELQNLARDFRIDIDDFVPSLEKLEKEDQLKALKESLKNRVVDDKNPSLFRDNQYCVECRRCINVCRQIQTVDAYGMNYRSIETKVGTPAEKPLDCIFCGQCSLACPTAAITEKDENEKLENFLADSKKLKIFQFAPSVRFTLGEAFGLEPGTFVEGKIVSVLKKLGVDLVYDTTFGADLTIMEEAEEFLERLIKKARGQEAALPMFTSCCPAWVLFVEKYYPEFILNLSSCKSPQQMVGALIKRWYAQKKKINPQNIASLSLMPCVGKKFEAQREEMSKEGVRDVDLVVTTRELIRLIRKKKIDFNDLEEAQPDPALGIYSGSGVIFGATGGVMEAALTTAFEKLTGKDFPRKNFSFLRENKGIRQAEIVIPKTSKLKKELVLRVAIVNEIRNARKILEKIKEGEAQFDFIEVMACPDGCLGGGGQPIPTNEEIREKRKKAIYERFKNLPLRKSHENQAVQKLYEEFLGRPGGEISENLLHTQYQKRSPY